MLLYASSEVPNFVSRVAMHILYNTRRGHRSGLKLRMVSYVGGTIDNLSSLLLNPKNDRFADVSENNEDEECKIVMSSWLLVPVSILSTLLFRFVIGLHVSYPSSVLYPA
jgi:hypothetical protein